MIFNESLTSMSNEDDEEAAIHEHLDGIDDDQTQQINQLDTRDRISDSFVIFSTTQHYSLQPSLYNQNSKGITTRVFYG